MPSTPTFGTQIIGQTEKALNALLDRHLAGSGLTEPQWVTLTIAVMSGGSIDGPALLSRVAGALKLNDAEAQARIEELAAAELLETSHVDASPVNVTDAGSHLHQRIRTEVADITQRLWATYQSRTWPPRLASSTPCSNESTSS